METDRRCFPGGLALRAIAATYAIAARRDGYPAGEEVTNAAGLVRTIPRKFGTITVFTASLDAAQIKAAFGGWARYLTKSA